MGRWQGAFIPFAVTPESRLASGDPRPSLAARYDGRDAFLARTGMVAEGLVQRGLLLPRDTPGIVSRAIEYSPVYGMADAMTRVFSPYNYGPFYKNPLYQMFTVM